MKPFPLVLLHHAGGSAAVFDELIKALPPDIESIPLELPGRGRRWREDPLTTVEEAVDDLAKVVGAFDREFAVFGHSLGAYLGLALVTKLEARGTTLCRTLFASANAGPGSAVLPFTGSPLDTTEEEIFAIAAQSGGGIPEQILSHAGLRERTARLLRADFSLSESFVRKIRHVITEAELVVCCGTDDIFTDAQLAEWRLHSTADTEIHRFAGGHFYLAQEADELAEVVTSHLLR